MASPAHKLISTLHIEHDEWLEYRRLGIGGSDVAAICGLSKYKSPMHVYLEKLGELPPTPDNPKMKAGRMLEPVIAEWFAEETGIKVQRRNAILQHKDYPFMLANIDRWVKSKNEGLEIKNTSEFNRSEWSGENAPIEYLLQCNHYMAITGADRWHLAVLIGGWEFQHRIIERDEEIIQMLIERETQFWTENVLAKNPPGVTAMDTAILNQMYPLPEPLKKVEIEDQELITTYQQANADFSDAKYRLEEAKNRVKAVMQDAELATYGEPVFSWKANKNGVRTFRYLGEE